ncbi:hypothetical protein EDP2_3117 [Enterobacter cloacae S611]|uniref:Uncharacterized protein n=1 Tax=Enterobacter cloacae S611 TaxID=1399146 RepID=A0ABP2ZNY4_ENTCL|nr:hypothetical protein EDP2_3117 [Enterobacter cloacae S611]
MYDVSRPAICAGRYIFALLTLYNRSHILYFQPACPLWLICVTMLRQTSYICFRPIVFRLHCPAS